MRSVPGRRAAVPSTQRSPQTARSVASYRHAPAVPASPFKGVHWSLSYAALLLYVVVIVTYAVPYGYVIMSVALIGLLLEARLRLPAFLVLFGALVGLAFLSQFSSLWAPIVREESLEFGKLWLIALVAVCTLRDRPRARLFMLIFLGAFALYPVRGALVNYFVGGYSVQGRAIWNYIYANPNDLAALTLLALSVTAAFFVAEPRGWLRRLSFAGLVVLPILILLTQSRGVFIGLVFFAVVALAGHRNKIRIAGFAFVVLIASTMVLPSSAWERLGMVKTLGSGGVEALDKVNDEGSAGQRYEIWRTSFRIIRDHPVSGIGWSAYPRANALYAPRLGARDTHSTYLNIAAEIGIPGLLLFLLVIGVVATRAELARRRLVRLQPVDALQIRLLLLGLAGFLIAGVFGSYGKLTFLYLHLVLIWVITDLALRRNRARHMARPRQAVQPAWRGGA